MSRQVIYSFLLGCYLSGYGLRCAPIGSQPKLLLFNKHQLGATTLTHYIVNYNVNLTLSPGLDSLFFVATNSTAPDTNQTFDLGINNITFRRR